MIYARSDLRAGEHGCFVSPSPATESSRNARGHFSICGSILPEATASSPEQNYRVWQSGRDLSRDTYACRTSAVLPIGISVQAPKRIRTSTLPTGGRTLNRLSYRSRWVARLRYDQYDGNQSSSFTPTHLASLFSDVIKCENCLATHESTRDHSDLEYRARHIRRRASSSALATPADLARWSARSRSWCRPVSA